jgi:predicted RNA-binding Zn-ribbon protein involved in translation (DUF1610 family)
VYRTIIGLILVAATAVILWLLARGRYRCPFCGRIVRWKDVNCPHCGEDMKMRHREGSGRTSSTWVQRYAPGEKGGESHRRRHRTHG